MSPHFPVQCQQGRTTLLTFLAATVVTGTGCLCVTVAAPASAQVLVAWYGGVLSALLSAAVTAVAGCVRLVRQTRAEAAAINADLVRLADEALPAMAQRVRDGVAADTACAEIVPSFGATHQGIIRMVAGELGAGERMRAAAMATCANAAGRMQALATSMLADLREMEGRHDEDVLDDLLKLDHSTAQAGRLADSIAVLSGGRSGRRWTKPIVMESVLRGAMGRISAYQRIRVHSASTVAIVVYAAEGIMHALAELLDNAARFSPPSDEVHVYVEDVHTGVIVSVEDSGLVMSPAALARAERAVSAEPLSLAEMSGTRLGLNVVGQLARKHDLTVSFRSSSRGGTAVVVMIPRKLITQPRPDPVPAAHQEPEIPAAPGNAETATRVTEIRGEIGGETPGQPDALPKRRRGRTLAAAHAAAPKKSPEPNRPRLDAGARFGAFRGNARRDAPSTSEDGMP